jgi:hypothetical protein
LGDTRDGSRDLETAAARHSYLRGLLCIPLLASYAIGIGLSAHHVIVWGTLLVVGAVPVWDGADPGNVGLVLAGVAVIVCGAFDHRLFVQTFGSPSALDHESDVAAR